MNKKKVVGMVVALSLVGGIGGAQVLPGEKKEGKEKAEIVEKGKKRLELAELIVLWRMVRELDLDEEQTLKILPRWRKLQEAKENYLKKRRELVKELRELVEEGASPEKIGKKVEEIEKLKENLGKKREKIREEIKNILTPQQRAKYLIFEERVGEKLKKTMERLREVMKRRMRTGPPPKERFRERYGPSLEGKRFPFPFWRRRESPRPFSHPMMREGEPSPYWKEE